jgi:hypothetical protein
MTKVILKLVELAIALAQAHLNPDDIKATLVEIITTSVRTYEDQTGAPLDPRLIGIERTL